MREYYLNQSIQPIYGTDKYSKDRLVSELLGLCKGLIADGRLVDSEIACLKNWMGENAEIICDFPARSIAERLVRIYSNGSISDEERNDLLCLLNDFSGVPVAQDSKAEVIPTTLPLDAPAPEVVFPGKSFCFTGKFVGGTRNWCVEQVVKRGGHFHDTPTKDTCYVVIGSSASDNWAHSSYGRKIEKAVELRESGASCKIISEQRWSSFLNS